MNTLPRPVYAWNVKNADSVFDAVSCLRHGLPECKSSPSCPSHGKAWGAYINEKRALILVMEKLNALARGEHTTDNGVNEYKNACLKNFYIEKRRGYVRLVFFMSPKPPAPGPS